ncbi:hypothetical protein E4U41_005066 [Claviceps citrina]|nr:hypothetical protein E4U41_005066 [Claviceps citrina]
MHHHDSHHLRFDLDQHFGAKIYTSGSIVRGNVLLHLLGSDKHFDKVEVSLVGVSTTQSTLLRESGTMDAPFLKLVMPLPSSHLPADKVFLAGKEYSFPFPFMVPFQLSMGACRHKCITPSVREQHLRLPPTMSFWDRDDQSPQMTQIKYAICVVATKKYLPQSLPLRIIEGYHVIRLLPAFSEDAPLDIASPDNLYAMSRSKTIRRKFVARKLGGSQPPRRSQRPSCCIQMGTRQRERIVD